MSVGRLILLATAGLSLASAASCPYARGNEAHDAGPMLMHPEAILEARFREDGPDFGRCTRKSKVAGGGPRNKDWWPCQLSLAALRQHADQSNPWQGNLDYATEFSKLDVDQLTKDLTKLQKTSQAWWPADFGDYGPFLIRLAWHSAGTYRSIDGRGGSGMGQQRYAPLNSWPDNASLDKARRLLWPIKQKYGSKLSWADLIVYSGNVALENMGFPTYGFGFGRVDTWQADDITYWGSETVMFPNNKSTAGRYNGSTNIYQRASGLEAPLADADMGLIYVDPRGPQGIPDPKASALDIRETFGRMGMNDEETVALIAGGHAFGKTHGAFKGKEIGPEPNAAAIELQGLGWRNSFKNNTAQDKYTSGIEVIWSKTPTTWANEFLKSLYKHEWTLIQSPDGAPQWIAESAVPNYPDPFIPGKFRKPTMLTSDLALRYDPTYHNISKTFHDNFDHLTEKFGLAWYKLLHRDMGPLARYLGPHVPKKDPLIWQDPIPAASHAMIDDGDVKALKSQILAASGVNISNLVTTAWGAASSFRIADKRGGANGARIFLKPQNTFTANNPTRLETVRKALQGVKDKFNKNNKDKQVSLADLVVLGGNAAIEKAAKDAGADITVPFTPGRMDTTQELTDVDTFAFLEPQVDGFRNYGHGDNRSRTEELFVDRAAQLTMSPPEMVVVVGGMRALSANYDGSKNGILTDRPGKLTNDFFVNLLDISNSWSLDEKSDGELFQGKDHYTGVQKYTATRSDLILGSHPELRALSEVYAAGDAQDKFVNDFVKAWAKVMDLDRYDIKGRKQNNVQ